MGQPGVYVLSGCASGIGRGLTGALLAEGHRVVATDLAHERLLEIAREDGWDEERTLLERLDVCDAGRWTEVLNLARERFQRVDGVMNIAGFLEAGWVHEIADKDVHLHFDINVKGVVFGTRAAAKLMLEQGSGHIINIASLASLAPVPGLSLYSASKYAVRAFSMAVAQELRPSGIAVTVVCPDAVQTPMLDKQKKDERAALTFSGPRRFLTVDDICHAIVHKVLKKRPFMVVLPRHRGWLARLGDWMPGLTFRLGPMLQKRGRKQQEGL
jgi:3-oxoacyl-[acyl-carrier protein] reductase